METAMMVGSISLIVPTIVSSTLLQSDQPDTHDDMEIFLLSRATSFFLLLLFSAYVYFQISQHVFLRLIDPTQATHTNDSSSTVGAQHSHAISSTLTSSNIDQTQPTDTNGSSSTVEVQRSHTISPTLTNSILFFVSLTVAIGNSFYLVRSIEPFAHATAMKKSFISLVIIPFAGDFGKWIELLRHSRTEEITLPLRAIITTILQIVLFALPMLTVLGWIFDKPVALDFDIFEASVLFLALLLANSVMAEGKVTYFEGAMLMGSCVPTFTHTHGTGFN
jgi:Ca2+:H+ antiporter